MTKRKLSYEQFNTVPMAHTALFCDAYGITLLALLEAHHPAPKYITRGGLFLVMYYQP